MDYVGCSLKDLKAHLESQFQEGMTWDNYGIHQFGKDKDGWHIDHIIPCNVFNLADPFERNACFFYMNLQPLWGIDNIVKSDTCDAESKAEYLEMYKSMMGDAASFVVHEEYDSALDSETEEDDEADEANLIEHV